MDRKTRLQFDTLETRRCLSVSGGFEEIVDVDVSQDIVSLNHPGLLADSGDRAEQEFGESPGINDSLNTNRFIDEPGLLHDFVNGFAGIGFDDPGQPEFTDHSQQFWDMTDGSLAFDGPGFNSFKDQIFADDEFDVVLVEPPEAVVVIIPVTIQPIDEPSPGAQDGSRTVPTQQRSAARVPAPAPLPLGPTAPSTPSDPLLDNALAMVSRQEGTETDVQPTDTQAVVESPQPSSGASNHSEVTEPAAEPAVDVAVNVTAETSESTPVNSAVFSRSQILVDPALPDDEASAIVDGDSLPADSEGDEPRGIMIAAEDSATLEKESVTEETVSEGPESVEPDWISYTVTSLISPVTTDLLQVATGATAEISASDASSGFTALARVLATVSDTTSTPGVWSGRMLLGAGLSMSVGGGVIWATIKKHRSMQVQPLIASQRNITCSSTIVTPGNQDDE